MTRSNAATAAIDKSGTSIILMAAVSEVASKTDFKVALERDPPMDLAEFYHEAEKYLRQEDVEADDAEINVMNNRGLFGVGNRKENYKRRADDDFREPKRQRRESKFSSYTDLTEISVWICLDTRR